MDEDTTSAAFFAYHSIHVVRELFFRLKNGYEKHTASLRWGKSIVFLFCNINKFLHPMELPSVCFMMLPFYAHVVDER